MPRCHEIGEEIIVKASKKKEKISIKITSFGDTPKKYKLENGDTVTSLDIEKVSKEKPKKKVVVIKKKKTDKKKVSEDKPVEKTK